MRQLSDESKETRIRMTSIRHFPATQPLPDWRNFGVILRLLIGINLVAVVVALVMAPDISLWPERYVDLAGSVEPWLLGFVTILAGLRDVLWRLPQWLGQAIVVLIAGVLAHALHAYWQSLAIGDGGSIWRSTLLAMLASILMLAYFSCRARAFSPAQSEARLAALNARIRPHFLFNSLNAVLSLIRARPQQAEAALESLSDLFRAAMRDPSEMVSLADEIALARQYLELEHLRLGERLTVDWKIGQVSMAVPIPPLMLQPLLENAVYHGIEPAPAGGTVDIEISQRGEELKIVIANPTLGQVHSAAGNQIALANIRERLALYYDLEAQLEISQTENHYEVRISLPCQRKPH